MYQLHQELYQEMVEVPILQVILVEQIIHIQQVGMVKKIM